jgi:O-antigen ligase
MNLMNVDVLYLEDGSKQVWAAAIVVALIAMPWIFAPIPELPLVIVLGVAALIIGINHPVLVLAIFLCFSLLRLHELFPSIHALRVALVFSVLTSVAAAWHIFVTRSVRPFYSFELGALTLFFALVTFGMAFAESSTVAWDYWTSVYWKIAAMTLLIAWIPQSPAHFGLLARTLVIGGLAVAVAAIYNKYLGVGLVEDTRVTVARDIEGNLGDPNELALVLLIPLSFSLALVAYRPGAIDRALGAIAAVTILVAIVFTQSRGGFLGTLAVLGVFGLRLKSRVLFGGAAVVVAVFLYEAMAVSERVAEYGSISRDESVLGRLNAWKGAIAMALDRPLTGVGLHNFGDTLPDYQPGLRLAPHSTWFGVLGEIGIPGFIVFVVLVVAAIRAALRSRRILHLRPSGEVMKSFSTALVAAFAGFCIAGSFLTHGFTWPLYFLIGLTAALSRYVREPDLPRPAS